MREYAEFSPRQTKSRFRDPKIGSLPKEESLTEPEQSQKLAFLEKIRFTSRLVALKSRKTRKVPKCAPPLIFALLINVFSGWGSTWDAHLRAHYFTQEKGVFPRFSGKSGISRPGPKNGKKSEKVRFLAIFKPKKDHFLCCKKRPSFWPKKETFSRPWGPKKSLFGTKSASWTIKVTKKSLFGCSS